MFSFFPLQKYQYVQYFCLHKLISLLPRPFAKSCLPRFSICSYAGTEIMIKFPDPFCHRGLPSKLQHPEVERNVQVLLISSSCYNSRVVKENGLHEFAILINQRKQRTCHFLQRFHH